MCGPSFSSRSRSSKAPNASAAKPKAPPLRKRRGAPTVDDVRRSKSAAKLRRWAGDRDPRVRAQVARHPSTEPGTLEQLTNDPDIDVVRSAAKHRATPSRALTRLSTSSNASVRRAVAGHPNAQQRVVVSLLRDLEWSVREAAVVNAVIERATLLAFLDSPAGRPHRHRFATDPTLDDDRLLMWLKAVSWSRLIDRDYVYNLFDRPTLSDRMLAALAPGHLAATLRHPSLGPASLLTLVEEGCFDDVRNAVELFRHPLVTEPALSRVLARAQKEWAKRTEDDFFDDETEAAVATLESGMLDAIRREVAAVRRVKGGHLAPLPKVEAPCELTERAERQLVRLARQMHPAAATLRIQSATRATAAWHAGVLRLVRVGPSASAIRTAGEPRPLRIVNGDVRTSARAGAPGSTLRIVAAPGLLPDGAMLDYLPSRGEFFVGTAAEHAHRVDLPSYVVVP